MAKLIRKLAILAKIETTMGTLPALVAADAMEVFDVALTPIEGDEVASKVVRPYFGDQGSTLVTQYQKMAFGVPLAGVGLAGTIPGYAPLLRGCAVAATNTPGTSTIFAPITEGIETLGIMANIDGVRYQMPYGRGNFEFTLSAKQIPEFKFDFTGAFNAAADAALPAVAYTVWQQPLGVNKINTTALLDSVAVEGSEFKFNCGNQVSKRDLINVDTVEITDRKSSGSITFQNTSVAAKNWIAMAQASARVPLEVKHGQGATNTFKFTAPTAQLGKPSYSDNDGVQMVTIPLRFVPSAAGNDEWAIEV